MGDSYAFGYGALCPFCFVRQGVRTLAPTLASPSPRRTKKRPFGRFVVEQVMGVGPTSKAWEALILPMNYTCMDIKLFIYADYFIIFVYKMQT